MNKYIRDFFLKRHRDHKEGIGKKIIRAAAVAIISLALLWVILRLSPYPQLQTFQMRPGSIRYYDRNGFLLQVTPLANGLRREKPQEMPEYVKDVFIFSEDRRFYTHMGVDGFALLRALYQNITTGRRVSGASTITMQLARIISDNARAHTGSGNTLIRKTAEMINALRLETRLSKNQILELYLNSLPFGFNTEGVASAARTFFSSDLSMLSPAQIFCLAVIPRRPSLYNPLDNPQACVAAAMELQVRFSNDRKHQTNWPLFTDVNDYDWRFASSSARRFEYPFELPHLIRSISMNISAASASASAAASAAASATAGEVHLTIDIALQRYLERSIISNVMLHYTSRLTNGAAIVINNETGEILAWVGSADFFNTEAAGQIDGVLALNQSGSSMKPFLYAMALENGFSPTDVVADIPMNFGGGEIYIPRNFNNRYNGPMLLRSALASSLNVPAVYLLNQLGEMNYSRLLLKLGFDSIEHSAQDAGLGLALGNAPVSLLELVRGFSVFPRDGVYLPLVFEMRTEDTLQKDFTSKEDNRIFSADTARIICSFLSDSDARAPTFGSGMNFRTAFPAIFKTGTANQFQSIVALGATRKYTAGVWMGNFTGETVIGRTGSSIPAAITRDALAFLEGSDRRFHQEFESPVNWKIQRVCAISGMNPSDACFSVINEYVMEASLHTNEQRMTCTWHQIINGRSETTFPAEYQAWFNAFTRHGFLDYASSQLEIITPRDGFVYLTSPGIGIDEIRVEVIGGESNVLSVTHNNNTFNVGRPFVFYLPRIGGSNMLRVQNADETQEIYFTVEY